MDKIKTAVILVVLFVLTQPIYKPLFDYGFFPIHDDMQFARVKEMADALRDHQFPVRIVKNLGYGYHYPLYNFYAPLPYYVGGLLNLIGFSVLNATKLMFFLPNFLSLIFMLFLFKKMTKSNLLGIFAGILYAYFPYRAVDNYVRGTIGEVYVMMFLPILIWGIYEMFHGKFSWKFIIALSGIILSHNIYAYIVFLFLLIFIVLHWLPINVCKRGEKLKISIQMMLGTLITLGVTAFFWLPAIAESSATQLSRLSRGGFYFGNYFIKLNDLVSSDFGYGGAAGGTTFMIGKIHLLTGFIALIFLIYQIVKNKKIDFLAILFLFLTAFSIFLTNKASDFVWKTIPLLSFSQYPMRFIFFIAFFLILFIIQVFSNMKKLFNPLSFIALISFISLLIIWKNSALFKSKYNYEFKGKLISENYIRYDVSQMADEYLPKEFALPLKKDEIANDSINATKKSESKILKHTASEMIVMVQNKLDDNQINFPITYFPGWKLYVNSKEARIEPMTKLYLIAANFAKGDYLVRLEFTDTPVRMAGNIISLLSLSLLVTLGIVKNKKYGSR